MRLICFPHAGGAAAAFHAWGALAPRELEIAAVTLPGRGGRAGERPLDDWNPLLDELAGALAPWTDRPFALFGHSLGGMIAYELALRWSSGGRPGPVALIVAGVRPPHVPPRRSPAHALPDAPFLEQLRQLEGTAPEALASRELMKQLLPALRADFRLAETWPRRRPAPAPCRLAAYGGEQDRFVPAADLERWADCAPRGFRHRRFPGGHFFVRQRPELMVAAIAEDAAG